MVQAISSLVVRIDGALDDDRAALTSSAVANVEVLHADSDVTRRWRRAFERSTMN